MTGNERQCKPLFDLKITEIAAKLINNPELRIRRDACWVLSNIIACNREEHINAVIKTGVPPTLFKQCLAKCPDMPLEITWVITNAAGSLNNKQMEYMLREGYISALCSLLVVDDNERLIPVLEALFTVCSTYTERREQIVQQLIECGGLEEIRRLHNLNDFDNATNILTTLNLLVN